MFVQYPEKARRAKIMEEGNGAMEACMAAYTDAVSESQEFTLGTYTGTDKKTISNCFSLTNFAIVNRNLPPRGSKAKAGTYSMGKKLYEFLGNDYYTGRDIYKQNYSASFIDKLVKEKYAIFLIVDHANNKIMEFDLMHDHYLYIYKDGTANVYPAATTSQSFVYPSPANSLNYRTYVQSK